MAQVQSLTLLASLSLPLWPGKSDSFVEVLGPLDSCAPPSTHPGHSLLGAFNMGILLMKGKQRPWGPARPREPEPAAGG